MTLRLYGLKNCDTCRKAVKALEASGASVDFIDIREGDVSADDIARWETSAGWETLLNTRSTTWRGLSDADKSGLDASKALSLMTEHRALVKRPVIETDGEIYVSWSKAVQATLLG